MTTLLAIPNEIQLKIAANLNYLDFHQMRLTCKYLYNLPTKPFLKNALVKLETDFGESEALAPDPYMRPQRGPYVDHLVTLGYTAREMLAIKHYRVCHECSSIMPKSAFPQHAGPGQRPPYSGFKNWLPYSNLERQCGTCYMASAAYLADDRRWVDFYASYPLCWSQLILCKTCGELRKYACGDTGGFPDGQRNLDGYHLVKWDRQRFSSKCHECWMTDNETWLLSRKQLQEERDALKQIVASLSEYITWMEEVHNCYPEGEGERWEDIQQ